MWTYQARCHRVIDADTLDLGVDLGFDVTIRRRVRLAAINAPELGTPEGRAARDWVTQWVDNHPGDWPLTVTTRQTASRDRYGRWVAVISAGGVTLNQQLIDAGHATVWPPPKL